MGWAGDGNKVKTRFAGWTDWNRDTTTAGSEDLIELWNEKGTARVEDCGSCC
jgi:hypothetical protein